MKILRLETPAWRRYPLFPLKIENRSLKNNSGNQKDWFSRWKISSWNPKNDSQNWGIGFSNPKIDCQDQKSILEIENSIFKIQKSIFPTENFREWWNGLLARIKFWNFRIFMCLGVQLKASRSIFLNTMYSGIYHDLCNGSLRMRLALLDEHRPLIIPMRDFRICWPCVVSLNKVTVADPLPDFARSTSPFTNY